MNKFQRNIRRHTHATNEVLHVILASIEDEGIEATNMREAYTELNAAHQHLTSAIEIIARIRNEEGGEA